MRNNYFGSYLMSEDTQCGIQLIDFLNAGFQKAVKSVEKENFIYMNRKQIVADKVEHKMFPPRRYAA